MKVRANTVPEDVPYIEPGHAYEARPLLSLGLFEVETIYGPLLIRIAPDEDYGCAHLRGGHWEVIDE